MLIKTFIAETSAAALKQVRTEMGITAVVLKTRQIGEPGQPGGIEITACLDNPTIEQSTSILSGSRAKQPVLTSRPTVPSQRVKPFVPQARSGQQPSVSNRFGSPAQKNTVAAQPARVQDKEIAQLRSVLQDADISPTIIESLLANTLRKAAGSDDLPGAMLNHLTSQFSATMLPKITFNAGDRVLFIGAAGCGKTSLMGKLAAQLVFQDKQKTTLLTLDSVKIGASDELQSYADILGVPACEYAEGQSNVDPHAVTVIDTPSLPHSGSQLQSLADAIVHVNPTHRIAVFPSLTRSSDVADFVRRIAPLRPTHLAMTMLDLTDRWGNVMTALRDTGLPLAFVTNSPSGTGALSAPDPALFARTILKMGACLE